MGYTCPFPVASCSCMCPFTVDPIDIYMLFFTNSILLLLLFILPNYNFLNSLVNIFTAIWHSLRHTWLYLDCTKSIQEYEINMVSKLRCFYNYVTLWYFSEQVYRTCFVLHDNSTQFACNWWRNIHNVSPASGNRRLGWLIDWLAAVRTTHDSIYRPSENANNYS